MYRDIPEDLRLLIEPVVQDHGLELVDVELARGRVPWRVCVIVDNPSGDGRVSIERCAALSRELGVQLDAHDAIPVGYRLEVSSPGLDRTLSREKDFAATCGQEVRIETRHPLAGRRRFRGELTAFADGVARVRVEGGEVDIPFQDVARARRVYRFTPADFGRRGARGDRPGRSRDRGSDGSGVERA